MDIRSIDLNLLPILDALLRHRSVTRAAVELDMSQSALSAALARLRTLLGDPLFVRTGRGLDPTPRALALAEPLRGLLDVVRDLVMQSARFDAARSRRSFRLLLSDVGGYVLWPRIVAAVRRQAPGVTLELGEAARTDVAAELSEGRADVAIGSYPTLPASLMQRRLFDRSFVALVRDGHPLARRRLSLRDFATVPHVVVRGPSGVQDRIDAALAERGRRRTDVIEVPTYLMVPPLLASGDFLAVVPGQLAEAFGRGGGLVALELPVPLPASTVRLHWHRRFAQDAANAWLRAQVVGELSDG